MRVTTGFDVRKRAFQEVWRSICSSLDEPRSSLEEFENAVSFAQISLQKTPPAFRRGSDYVKNALRVAKAESFQILDKRNRDRLLRCYSNLQSMHSETKELREKILRQHNVGSFAVPLASGKIYKVRASEMKDRLCNAAYNLALNKVSADNKGRATVTLLQAVAARAQMVRHRYLRTKASLLKEYLETGAHQSQLPDIVQHIIAELRFLQMEKRDIAQLLSHFGRGSARRQIDAFIRLLTSDHQYTVYTIVSELDTDSAKTVLPNLQLLRQAHPVEKEGVATGLLVHLLQSFEALAQGSVVAKSEVTARNPAQAVAQARLALDVVASLVAYLDWGKLGRRSSFLQQPASLVYEKKHLVSASGFGAAPDDSLKLRPSMNRDLWHLLEVTGANLPASSRTELQERGLTAMHWYRLGTMSQTLEERYVDHVIALEVLLSANKPEQDKKQVLADRATILRRILKVGRDDHIDLIKRLYISRNDLVHAGLYRARSLLQDSHDLENAVLESLFAVLDGLKNGCCNLQELLDRIEKERIQTRRRRIRKSRLPVNQTASFRGSLLQVSGNAIADLRGTLTLIDEGEEGYAYHELSISDAAYKKPFRVTSIDEYYFKGKAAGYQVELRDGYLVGKGFLFLAIVGGAKHFTYRAFDNVVFS